MSDSFQKVPSEGGGTFSAGRQDGPPHPLILPPAAVALPGIPALPWYRGLVRPSCGEPGLHWK